MINGLLTLVGRPPSWRDRLLIACILWICFGFLAFWMGHGVSAAICAAIAVAHGIGAHAMQPTEEDTDGGACTHSSPSSTVRENAPNEP
jgi:hypothetical protein